MSKRFNRGLYIGGDDRTLNGVVLTITDENIKGVTRCYGTTVPADGDNGFAAGCSFWKSSGGSTGSTMYINEGSLSSADFNAIAGGGGALGNFSLNDAYDDGSVLAVDAGAVDFAGVHSSNNTVVVRATGSGHGIDFVNSGSGKDIDGSGSTWSISKAGAAVLTAITGCDALTAAASLTLEATTTGTITIGGTSTGDITIGAGGGTLTATTDFVITGSADATVLTVTAGDVVITAGLLSLDDDDTATGNLVIPSSTATTGSPISITADDLTTGSALYIDSDNGATFSGDGGYINCINGTDSVFKVQRYGALTIAGNAEGTASLTCAKGDLVLTDGALVITAGAFTYTAGDMAMSDGSLSIIDADNAASFSVTNDNATSASVVVLAGSGVFTGTTTTSWMTVTPSGLTTGTGIYAVGAGLTEGKLLHLATDATQTTGNALFVQNTGVSSAMTSGRVATFDHTSSAIASSVNKIGSVVSITSNRTVDTGGTTSDDFDLLSVIKATTRTAGTAVTTGAALYVEVQTTGTVTETSIGIEVVMDSGGTGDGVKITHSATGAVALNIVSAATSVSDVLITGSGVKADNKAVLEVTSSGNGAAGSSVLRVTSTGIPAANNSYLVDLDYTGATEETNDPILLHIDRGQSDEAGIQLTGSVEDVASSGLISMFATQIGATGVVMHSQHTSTGSAGNNDAVFTFKHEGLDSGDGVTEYVRVEAQIMEKLAGSEDGKYIVSCAANDSTLVQMLQLSPRAGGSLGQAVVGSGAGNAYVTSFGAYNLILDTNEGSSSSSITLEDAANGDVSVAINGTGSFNVQNLTYETNAGSQVTTTTTLTWGDAEGQVVLCTSAGGAYALTLPAVAVVGAGGWYTFIKNDSAANAITITGSGAETINGSNTFADMDADYDSLTIMTDGTEWFITAKNIA